MEFRPFLLKSHELPHSLGRLCWKRHAVDRYYLHPRGPRGSQSGREKRRDESFQVRAKEPLGTDSHRTISKNSSGCRLLIGHKKCFVLLCPIGEQFLLGSFRVFRTRRLLSRSRLVWVMHQRKCTQSGNFEFDINPHLISKYCLAEN